MFSFMSKIMRIGLALCGMMIAVQVLCTPVCAQVMKGAWVDASEEQISQLRKTELRVLVLDGEGQPKQGAAVQIRQVRHAFELGTQLDRSDHPLLVKLATADITGAPVWRTLNAVSLEPLTAWANLQSESKGELTVGSLEQVLNEAHKYHLNIRWGGLISADAGRWPGFAGRLYQSPLVDAIENYTNQVTRRYGHDVQHIDAYTHWLDHDQLVQRLGISALRDLFQRTRFHSPRTLVGLRFEDALSGDRLNATLQKIITARDQQIPLDYAALEVKLTGTLVQTQLAKSLQALDELGVPLVVCNLEITGPTPAAAGNNMEMFLRCALPMKNLIGIYLSGILPNELSDPQAALIDDKDNLTPAGEIFDRMFHQVWWTNDYRTSDELGNVRSRVFTGWYQIIAQHPDGVTATTDVYIPAAAGETTIVLQPYKFMQPPLE